MLSQPRRFVKKLLHLGKNENSLPHDQEHIALVMDVLYRAKRGEVICELGHPRLEKYPCAGEKMRRQMELDLDRMCATIERITYHLDSGEVYGHFVVKGPLSGILDDALSVMELEDLKFGMRAIRNPQGKVVKIVTWDLTHYDQEKKRV